jgi:hypothetical protein
MINQADTTVYGCIDEIEWQVYKGDTLIRTLNAWSPKIDFSEEGEGEYKVVLKLGGPGGEIAQELSVYVEKYNVEGCSSVSGYGMVAALLSILGIARRRED